MSRAAAGRVFSCTASEKPDSVASSERVRSTMTAPRLPSNSTGRSAFDSSV